MSDKPFHNTLSFWRAIEALSPQEVPKKKNNEGEYGHDLDSNGIAPWFDEEFLRVCLEPGKEWVYTVYGGLIDRADQVHALEKVLGSVDEVYDERLSGLSCLFSLKVNAAGRPIPESFVLCMSTWATGVVLRSGLASLADPNSYNDEGLHAPETPIKHPPSISGFIGFDQQAKALRDELAWAVSMWTAGDGVDMAWLATFSRIVATKLGVLELLPSEFMSRVTAYAAFPRSSQDPTKQEDELINSFFIRDINRALAAGERGAPPALTSFVKAKADNETLRRDVRADRRAILASLEPKMFPVGCWPSEHPLVWSQQVAINSAWAELRSSPGMFSVNGPPGTGKTTLLRDFVSAIVVERAKVISDLGDKAFLPGASLQVGPTTIPYYPLHARLAGYSIVVASSNNGAVENLSLELPLEKAIDPKWLKETDFFRDLATHVLGEPAWGLLAGKLGNSANRNKFKEDLVWPKMKNNGVSGMKEMLDRCARGSPSGPYSFAQAKSNFEAALRVERTLRDDLQALHDLPAEVSQLAGEYKSLVPSYEDKKNEVAARELQYKTALAMYAAADEALANATAEWEAHRQVRPGFMESLLSLGGATKRWRMVYEALSRDHRHLKERKEAAGIQLKAEEFELKEAEEAVATLVKRLTGIKGRHDTAKKRLDSLTTAYSAYAVDISRPDEEIERSSPWSVPAWREARIKVFLAALALHRAFIESNAAKMAANLEMAAGMLSKGLPSPSARVVAFDSLALVCPVISTAFASVSSMFGDIERPAIGWLLIDEAGQAPPQACVGALWRSHRAIVVGDPLQLEPVVTIPATVEAALAARCGNVPKDLFPSRTSAQRLADAQMTIGTMVGNGSSKPVWVGAPLRVHRRCDDPMFRISNEIAYGGLMVHQKTPEVLSLPPSKWIDVPKSTPPDGHWLPAEGHALTQLLGALALDPAFNPKDVFLISPFKDVVARLWSYAKAAGIDPKKVGTVHTTQGKEARVVILVLGGATTGARNWAASNPNLLNVATTRAKARLYVIGDKADWQTRNFFKYMAQEM